MQIKEWAANYRRNTVHQYTDPGQIHKGVELPSDVRRRSRITAWL